MWWDKGTFVRIDRHDETGGIIGSWLTQVALFLAVLAVIGFEVITVAVTSINLEDDARDVARAAARGYRDGAQRLPAARDAAETEAEQLQVTLVDVTESDGVVVAEVRKTADTLFIHHLGFLDDLVVADSTGRARWR